MLILTFNVLTAVVYFHGVSAADQAILRTRRELQNFTIGGEAVAVRRIVPVTNDFDQCYVHVTVHNSSSFRYGLENAKVTILSRAQGEGGKVNYTGFSDGLTDANGQACILVHCRAEGLVFVEKNGIGVFALNKSMQISRLPMFFNFDLKYNNEFIFFYTYPWGIVGGRNGPVFYSQEKDQCINANPNDYHFVFSYISIPDVLNGTVSPLTDDDPTDRYVWYYGLGNDRRTCYMKVKIKTLSPQLSIGTTSFLNSASGQRLGTFYTGPQYDISKAETSDRAACILFRCPAVHYVAAEDMHTYVNGTINGGPTTGCCLRSKNTNMLNITPYGFSSVTPFSPHQNYGPNEGIYMSFDSRNARARCFTGHDFLGSEYAMDVNKGFAFEYDCTPNAVCGTLPVIG
ncbi:uncharacterized protein LOC123541023 [Mercenaria mercenaria]|uniref:uncharacterized protein LOC123541023 n=1 Tax=Mercenaria mercenaria TaxID=6596 RepID=UPI00234EE171|nr:uncharacterized protein LOC123541023 [Mercenaria mercenaria]